MEESEVEALSDVLDSIRVKGTIAAMDDRPRFKRIYGTDIDPENTRDNEWQELMARHKIKQRLKLARDRRMSKIKEMEKTIASNLKNSEISISPEPLKRNASKSELLQEYRAMKGKSVSLKPSTNNENVDISSMTSEHDVSTNKRESRKDTDTMNTPQSSRLSPENNGKVTTFISAVIETPNSKVIKTHSDLGKSHWEDHTEENESETNKQKNEEDNWEQETQDGEEIEDRGDDGYDNDVEYEQSKKPNECTTNNETNSDKNEEVSEEEVVENESQTQDKSNGNFAGKGAREDVTAEKNPKKKAKLKKKTKLKSKTKEQLKSKASIAVKKQENKEEDQLENKQQEVDSKPKKTLNRWKKSVVKAMPLTTMCSKLRERISEENERQRDLLETIRILRGISKSEFYKDIDSDSENEEPSEEESKLPHELETSTTVVDEDSIKDTQTQEGNENNELKLPVDDQTLQEENENNELKLPVVVFDKGKDAKETQTKKRSISRVDTRWPVGHRFHTKPADQKYLSLYLKPIHSKLSRSKINIHNLPRTAKEITEYLQWRERLLEIAYLNEFSHLRKMSLMSFGVPLPRIQTNRFAGQTASNTSRSSRSTSSASRHHTHSISIHHNSVLTFHKSSGTKSKKNSDNHQHKRKKNERSQEQSINPYLSRRGTEKNLNKHSNIKTKHAKEVKRDFSYGFVEENELETLISKISQDSKHEVVESRNKSQSTDSAINEPSYDSDEYDSDVINSNVNDSELKQDNGKSSLQERDVTKSAKCQKRATDEDFMQTVHYLRTGRYRYLQPVDLKRGHNHHRHWNRASPQRNVTSKTLEY